MTTNDHPLAEAANLASVAADLLRMTAEGKDPGGSRIDSIAWRLADALLDVAQYVRCNWPDDASPGIHYPTGRGAKLQDARNHE
jgi:hypothetical protein